VGAQGDSGQNSELHENGKNNETWEVFLSLARSSRKNGELKKAEEAYRLVVKVNPDCLEAWTELCVLLLQERRETEAERVGKQLLKVRGQKGMTWAQLRSDLRHQYVDRAPTRTGTRETTQGQIDRSQFSPIFLKPSSPRLSRPPPKGLDETLANSRPQAEPEKQTAEDAKPFHRRSQQTATSEDANESTPSRGIPVAHISDTRSIADWLSTGKAYAKEHKYEDAEHAFRKSLELEPDSIEASTLLADALIKLREYVQARDILLRVKELDPRNSQALYLLGVSYLNLKEYLDASRSLYECVLIDQNNDDAWGELGVAYVRQSKHVQAQKALLKALKLRRSDPRLLTYYGISLKQEGKYDRAENVFRMAINANPNFPPAWDELSKVLKAQGKAEAGKTAAERARTLATRLGIPLTLE
jgi:cytochrome c-type biogenesis protein CcmH/NrfG